MEYVKIYKNIPKPKKHLTTVTQGGLQSLDILYDLRFLLTNSEGEFNNFQFYVSKFIDNALLKLNGANSKLVKNKFYQRAF